MKKLLLLTITVMLICFMMLFSGCDNKQDDGGSDNNGSVENEICEHVPVTDLAVAPTCDEEGVTEGSHCSLCGEVLIKQESVPKNAHVIAFAPGKEPTCYEEGYTEYEYCINCKYSTMVVIPPAHNIQTEGGRAPTCYEDGYKTYEYCVSCEYSTKVVIPAAHSLVTEKGKDATCYEDGYKTYEYCENCPYSTKEIILAGHSPVYVEEKAATCFEDGHEAYEYCTVCSYSTFVPIFAQHKLGYADAKDPNCFEDGHNAYEYCDECGYTSMIVYPAAHKIAYEDGKEQTCFADGYGEYEYCELCDYSTKVIIPAGHDLEFVDAKTPTCNENGYENYEYCKRCAYNTRVIIPGGHLIEYVDAEDPTCEEEGHTAYEYCLRCEYTTREQIEPYGHNILFADAVKPTCMASGFEDYLYCDRCDFSTRVELPPIEHKYEDDWSVDVTATPEKVGVRSRHCVYDNTVGCGMRVDVTEYDYEYYTEGLVFTLLDEGSYMVSFPNAAGEDVIIPKTYLGIPVTYVGTFDGNVNSVYFPEGIINIGGGAFYSCPINNKTVVLPDTLKYLGGFAFRGEYSVDFGKSTPVMDYSPFSGTMIYEVHTSSLENWFKICEESLISILTPGGHVYINGELLEGEVTVPGGTTVIPRMAFANQLHVTSVVIPPSVTHINDRAFSESGIEKIEFLGTLDQWCEMILYSSLNGAVLHVGGEKVSGEIVIPRSVTEISSYLFEGQDVTGVVFHDGVESIGKNAFMGTRISELVLPKKLKNIGSAAFSGTDITTLIIPEGLTSIGWLAFNGLKLDVLVLPSTLKVEEDPFGSTTIDNLYFNCEELSERGGTYLKANNVYIGENVKAIPSGTFEETEHVYFAEDGALEYIGPGAFRNLWIKTVIIPDYVKEIDPTAFEGCMLITYAVVRSDAELLLPGSPNAVIGNETFTTDDGYVFLKSDGGYYLIGFDGELEGAVTLPEYAEGENGYTVIDFPSIHGVTELTVPKTVNLRMHYFLEKFDGLKSLILHGTVFESISYAGIERIELLGRLEFFPLLSYNDTLKHLVLGSSITEIPYEAFVSCIALETVILPETLERMEYGCFRECRSLRSVIIPASVKYMENSFSEWTYVGLAHRELTDEYMSGYHAVNVREFIYDDGKYKYIDNDGEVHLLEQIELPGPDDSNKDEGSTGGGNTDGKYLGEYVYDGVHSYDIEEGVYIYRAYLGDTSSGILVLPETIDGHRYVIGSGSFFGEDWLVSVTVRGVDLIQEGSFSECYNLTEVILEEGLVEICGSSFFGCRSLKEITIPASVTTITSTLFMGCDALENVIFLDVENWTFIGEWQRCSFCAAKLLKKDLASDVVGLYLHKNA